MKKTLLASLLVAAVAAPLSAQAQQGYIGIAAGQANNSFDIPAGLTGSTDGKKSAYKIYGGATFTPNWGVELGYADLGNPSVTVTSGAISATVNGRVSSFYVAGTGTLPVNEQFSLTGKLGVAFNRGSASATVGGVTVNSSGNKTSLMAGIGAAYHFNKNLAATVDFDDFGKTSSDSRANMWSIGLRYKF
jgi:OmpA-OmpF porin, OOP family